MKNTTFEQKYRDSGIASQRQYPNDSLVAFVARNYFKERDRQAVKILEIGCGSGANLWFLSREGFDVYGTDSSVTGLKCAEELLARWDAPAKLFTSDMTVIPIVGSDVFDAIVDVTSMQHLDLEDHRRCYAEVHRKLKKGGKFFSYHLGENSIIFRHGGGTRIGARSIDEVKDGKMPLAHNGLMTFLCAADAEAMLGEAGFSNITVDKVWRTYNNQEYGIEYLVITADK